MSNTTEQVTLPAASDALAQGLKKLFSAVVANHKTLAGSPLAEVSADVTEAVKDLGPVLSQVGALGGEAKSDPFGMAEAFALAGLEIGRAAYTAPAAPTA